MDVYRGRHFRITIHNVCHYDIYLRKLQNVGDVADALVYIGHVRNELFQDPSGAHGSSNETVVNEAHYKPTPDHLNQMAEY